MTQVRDNVIAFDRRPDRAHELELGQIRLARRVAELELEMQACLADLERRYAESRSA